MRKLVQSLEFVLENESVLVTDERLDSKLAQVLDQMLVHLSENESVTKLERASGNLLVMVLAKELVDLWVRLLGLLLAGWLG